MIKFMFSIFDKKASTYRDVFTVDSPSDAHRSMTNFLQSDRSSIYFTFAQDFALHCLYRFDTDTGKIHDGMQDDVLLRDYNLEFADIVSWLAPKEVDNEDNNTKDI